MKPLDLKVSIQNSYEAARSEAVRLDKPHIINHLAAEDALREQAVRDQSVVQTEAPHLNENLFAEDEYQKPDYTEAGGGKSGGEKKKKKSEVVPEPETAEVTPPEDKSAAGDSGFSTYA